jgi:hypothetical protein
VGICIIGVHLFGIPRRFRGAPFEEEQFGPFSVALGEWGIMIGAFRERSSVKTGPRDCVVCLSATGGAWK